MSLTENEKGKVLIVDDDSLVVDLLYVHLDEAGFDVLVAQNGGEAISQTETAQPDVILMDVMLPGIDGFETCLRLKENEATREIPVIFMTALSEREDKIRGFEVGGVDYVTKPIESQEVIARVTTHITLRDLQRKLKEENFLLQQEIIERKQAVEKLRESETRNRALLDAIPDVIFKMTRNGRYSDCSSGRSLNVSIPSAEHIGQNVVDVMPAEVARLILDNLHKTLSLGAIQVFEYQLEGPQGAQDYETRMVVGGANEVLGVVRNITERKRLEQQTIHNERLAALGQMAATLAHEINNPLQAIQSHLDLVLNYPLDQEKKEEYLHIIRRQIERLNSISQPILDLARSKSDSRRPVHITRLLQHVLELTDKQLEQHNIQVITDLHDVPPVLAVPVQLTQVFLNLVLNAIESISDDGQLCVAIYPENDWVVISFTNDGPAIPPDVQSYVFEPYFTTKAEGNGLGLWLSRNLVEQHGGSIAVANLTSDEGVTFTIKLPSL